MKDAYRDIYRGKRILVTGGLGCIGSNLVRTGVALGSQALAVAAMTPEYGGDLFSYPEAA